MDDPEAQTRFGEALLRFSHLVEAAALPAIPLLGGPTAGVVTELRLQRIEDAIEDVDRAVRDAAHQRSEPPEAVLEGIAQSPRLAALLLRSLAAAQEADDAEIRSAAARVLRQGLIDDANIDECLLYLSTLRRLGPPHLRLLRFMATRRMMNRPDGDPRDTVPEDFKEAWPDAADVLPGLQHALQSEGVIERVIPRQVDMAVSETWEVHSKRVELGRNSRERWRVTSYGRGLLDYTSSDIGDP